MKDDSSHSEVGGVRVDFKREVKVRESEAWRGCDECFEVLERPCSVVVPVFVDVVILMACEIGEWCRVCCEMINEATVVAGETEEGVDVSDGSGSWPILDSFNLGGIHSDEVLGDDVIKEFDGKFS